MQGSIHLEAGEWEIYARAKNTEDWSEERFDDTTHHIKLPKGKIWRKIISQLILLTPLSICYVGILSEFETELRFYVWHFFQYQKAMLKIIFLIFEFFTLFPSLQKNTKKSFFVSPKNENFLNTIFTLCSFYSRTASNKYNFR